jgi:D-3-phosphoglycerate dehydrogenase
MKNKILITYPGLDGLDELKNNTNFEIDHQVKPTPEKLIELIPKHDCLIIRSEVKVTPDVIKAADTLKLIVRAGTGVDNVDLKAATQKGIVVMNVPGGNTISAAEHTFSLILAMARNVPQAHGKLKEGKWEKKKFMGTELQGKVLGLVGLGRIGKEVARRARSFEMKVITYDPFASEDFVRSTNVTVCSLDELYAQADFISLHAPLNETTKHMINSESIAKMKKGVRIINCARGGIIDSQALYEALKSGHVKSAAIDVFEKEPCTESPLFELENVVVTPHLAASTEEAQIKIAHELSGMVVDFFQKGVIRNTVNMPSMDFETYKKQKPYLDLAEKMGSFQGQIIEGGIKGINIEYAGEISGFNTSVLTLSYLKGLLTPILDIKVNFVNAQVLARERKIKVKETKSSESEDYTSLITANVKTDKGELNVSATLFAHQQPRIVNIKGLDIDIIPQGHMILLENTDRPGVIGKIGTTLGSNNINIARMQVGRKASGGEAITIVNVDGCPSKETLGEISRIDGIKKVKLVQL